MGRYVYLDERGFNALAHATRTGAARCRFPARERLGRRTGKLWRARFRELRRWLVGVLGEQHYELGQHLLASAVSCRTLGEQLGRDASNAWRFKQRLCERLKEAIMLAALAAVGQPPVGRGAAWAWVEGVLGDLAASALAEATIEALKRDPTGCTVSPRTASALGPIDAWAASLAGYEKRHASLTAELVRAYVLHWRRILFGPEPTYLGVWRDDNGQYCLDLTRLFPDAVSAIAFGRRNGQHAVTHLKTLQTLPIEDGGEGRGAA
jgi:hypothetical protein